MHKHKNTRIRAGGTVTPNFTLYYRAVKKQNKILSMDGIVTKTDT